MIRTVPNKYRCVLEPYVPVKEPHISAKKHYISAKESYTTLYISTRTLHISKRDLYRLLKTYLTTVVRCLFRAIEQRRGWRGGDGVGRGWGWHICNSQRILFIIFGPRAWLWGVEGIYHVFFWKKKPSTPHYEGLRVFFFRLHAGRGIERARERLRRSESESGSEGGNGREEKSEKEREERQWEREREPERERKRERRERKKGRAIFFLVVFWTCAW